MKNISDTILTINNTYSMEKFNLLNHKERSNFKSELSKVITDLKKNFNIKILDDEYVFKLAAERANFKMMEMTNHYRALGEAIKNHRGDEKEIGKLRPEQVKLRMDLIVNLLGSYALLNAVDDQTIALNAEMLSQIMH